MKAIHYEIPDEFQNRNDVLIIHHCNGWYAFLVLLCLCFGFGPMISIMYGVIEIAIRTGEFSEDWWLAIVVALPCLVVGYLIFRIMKNFSIILHDDGIWYRRISGRISNYAHQEIKGYRIHNSYKNRYTAIFTNDKEIIRIDTATNNYALLQELLSQKFLEI